MTWSCVQGFCVHSVVTFLEVGSGNEIGYVLAALQLLGYKACLTDKMKKEKGVHTREILRSQLGELDSADNTTNSSTVQ